MLLFNLVFHTESYKGMEPPRKEEIQQRQDLRTPRIHLNDRQPEPFTDHTLDSTAKSIYLLSRRTPTSTATPHARKSHPAHTTQTQQGHRWSPLSQHNPVLIASGPCRTTTQTPPATALPSWGPAIMRNWGSTMDAQPASPGGSCEVRGEGAGGSDE